LPLAEHARLDGTGQRRRDPAHYTEALTARPRARLVLERERLCALGAEVTAYVTVISQRRRRVLAEELAACTFPRQLSHSQLRRSLSSARSTCGGWCPFSGKRRDSWQRRTTAQAQAIMERALKLVTECRVVLRAHGPPGDSDESSSAGRADPETERRMIQLPVVVVRSRTLV
jgi:hypothetical protein